MKKAISLLLAVLVVVLAIPFAVVPAAAVAKGTTGSCSWSFDGSVLTVTGSGKMADYNLVRDLPWGNTMTEIKIESGVTYIGKLSFYGCTKLKKVTLPSTLERIGASAFSRCTALEEIALPEGLKHIDNYAFSGCKSLSSLKFPDTLEIIDTWAISECTGLKEVVIPKGLTTIKSRAFALSSGIESITADEENATFFAKDNCLIKKEDGMLVLGCKTSVIPRDGSVTSIGIGAFHGCTGLEEFTIPDGIGTIGEAAFSCCSNLEVLTLSKSVSLVSQLAFIECFDLEDVNYTGSEDDRDDMTIRDDNMPLVEATWHYEYKTDDVKVDKKVKYDEKKTETPEDDKPASGNKKSSDVTDGNADSDDGDGFNPLWIIIPAVVVVAAAAAAFIIIKKKKK